MALTRTLTSRSCFNTASGMGQLQQDNCFAPPVCGSFNTASGMGQLQPRHIPHSGARAHFQYRKRYGPVATLDLSSFGISTFGFQYRKRYGPVATAYPRSRAVTGRKSGVLKTSTVECGSEGLPEVFIRCGYYKQFSPILQAPAPIFLGFFARFDHRYLLRSHPIWKTSTVECGSAGSAEVFFSWNILSTRSYSQFFLSIWMQKKTGT